MIKAVLSSIAAGAALCFPTIIGVSPQPAVHPVWKEFVAPDYPRLARQAHIHGDFKARVFLDSECRITKVDAGEVHLLLRGAIEKAVDRWRFSFCEGQPATVTTTFRFVLYGEATTDWTPTTFRITNPGLVEIITSPYGDFSYPFTDEPDGR